ncbi:MAG: DMT family transporter [Spirochaetales bacterium]|nr:DMT family transporter [Spirochaetales bacterium]
MAGLRADLYLLLCSIAWGGTYIAIKAGLTEISPAALLAYRMTGAALLFWIWSFAQAGKIRRALVWRGAILGVLMYVSFGLQTVGLVYTSVSHSAFITGFFVVFTAIFSRTVLRRKLRPGALPGVVLVTLGLYIFTGMERFSNFNVGDWLTLASAAGFGLHIALIDEYSRLEEGELRLLITLQLTVCALIALIFLPFFPGRLEPGNSAIIGLLFLIFPGTLLVAYLQGRYQKETTPTRAALIFALEPVFAALGGFLFFREVPGVYQWIGAAIMIFGTLFSELFRYREASRSR